MKKKWDEIFFTGVAQDFWQKVVPPEITELEVKFIEQLLNLSKRATILDVPCGNGRHAIRLSQKGYKITGIDISKEYIDELKEKISKEKLNIEVIKGDILKLELDKHFDGAYCLGNSFGYFDYEELVLFVNKISKSLKKEGRFIINSGVVAESILPNLDEKDWFITDDIIVLINNIYNTTESILETEYTFIRNGKREHKTLKHFIYTLAEIKRILQNAGLNVIEIYNSLEKSEYKLLDHQLYLVAEKN